VGIAASPELAAACGSHLEVLKETVSPWTARHMVGNFADTRRDPQTFWSAEAYERLCRLKHAVDPGDLFQANHPVVPAGEVRS
jgi:hypothetical protein